MDLEENIRIAANVAAMNELHDVDSFAKGFMRGAKSQAAKDYWYNEFKRQKIQSDSGQDQSLRNKPMKPSECFNGKSTLEANYATVQKDNDRRVTIIIPDLSKLDGVPEEYERVKQYQEYIDEHPDRPISFDNWKYMVEHYEKPELVSKHDIPHIFNGKAPHYPLSIIQSDPLYGATKKDFDNVKPKNIGIIGGVDHSVAILGMDLMSCIEQISFDLMNTGEAHIKGVIAIVPDEKSMEYAEEITRMIATDSSIHKIMVITKEHYDTQGKDSLLKQMKSITPIVDVMPQCINGVEYITDETYKESRACVIKKQKKVSHKRKNKRK